MTTVRSARRFNFVRDVIEHWAKETPDSRALLWTDGRQVIEIGFAELAQRAARAAGALAAAGIGRGDMVILLLNRELAWWDAILGCLRLGAIACPATTQLSPSDIDYRLAATKARMVIANPACAAKADLGTGLTGVTRFVAGGTAAGWRSFEEAMAAAAPRDEIEDTAADDDALCYFTSGTTGYPKMTIHRADYPLGHRVTGQRWLGLGPGDLCLNVADNGWAKAAWSSLCAPWIAGACIFAQHVAAFDPEAVIDLLERWPVTSLCAPPTAYRLFLQHGLAGRRFDALRHCVAAGEPLEADAMRRWRSATGLSIQVGYGQTETGLLCADLAGETVLPGAMGKPVPGIELAIVDDAGAVLPAGVEGLIALAVSPDRPAGLFKHYRGDAERTAQTRVGRWYLTGDRGRRDEEGYFHFVGRADDVILSSGYRIGPFEVESALNSHPAVVESAVVSSPDPVRGEIVKAFVVLVPGQSSTVELVEMLQDHVKRATAPYKYPRAIRFVTELPKTISGKILRRELRDQEWSDQPRAD